MVFVAINFLIVKFPKRSDELQTPEQTTINSTFLTLVTLSRNKRFDATTYSTSHVSTITALGLLNREIGIFVGMSMLFLVMRAQ